MRLTSMRAAAIAAVGVIHIVAAAQAQDYPNRVVKIINPYPAGSTTDLLARALAVGLSTRLGQQFVVENRGGAGGAIGTAAVARSDPDGYSLLFAPALVVSVHPQERDDTGYRPDAITPICQTFVNAMALAVKADSPTRNVADLVKAAQSTPGALNYGHQGPMTIPHLAMEEFLGYAKVGINGVPYRGEPAVMTDLLGGRLDVASIVLGTAKGQGDKVRVIGVFAETRHPAFPDVPTVKEQGFDVSPASFGGLLAPAATPGPIIAKLAEACAAAAKDVSYANAAQGAAQPPDYYADGAVFKQRLQRDIERKAEVIRRVKK
jgi:tripartite-type tricarboxylate transporter receptor subunit TctC